MLIEILFFILGIGLILGGANFLTDGASSVARSFGISPMVVGLTVVAFGTSAPEFVVSFMGALSGSSGIALGNVVGSNIVNILLIIGAVAVFSPINIVRNTIRWDIPMMFVVSAVLALMVYDEVILGHGGGVRAISRADGIILLILFALFLAYTIRTGLKDKEASKEDGAQPASKAQPWWLSTIYVLGGLGALIWGGDLFVSSSSAIARSLGMSEEVIGLTLVAVGTSLPELATSLVAALRGQADLAVGNVVGSNIFNILFILGMTATISPINPGVIGVLDFSVMLLAVVLFALLVYIGKGRRISRGEGAFLLLIYATYTALLLTQ